MNMNILRCWAEIDMDAVCGNFRSIRAFVPKEKKLMAVIKADGYGHGSVPIAEALEGEADFYGVAMLDEAVELRQAGIKTPILILGYTQPELFPVLVRYDIRPAVFHTSDAEAFDRCARAAGKIAPLHIALETGMGRIGYPDTDKSVEEIKKISALENVCVEGIFSHFAKADAEDKSYAQLQLERYSSFISKLEAAGIFIPVRHLCNSAATIEFPPKFDMLREGIILYGLRPSYEVDMEKIRTLRPAMSLRARVGHVKTIEAGDSVSYGCTYTADCRRRVATVCAGYADGVPRIISNKAHVLIHGKKAPIIGRICMDQLMADVSDIPETEVGDVATLFGRDGEEEIFADDVATVAQTIGYELVCGITKRVPRVYMRGGKIEKIHYGIPHEEA